MVYPIEEKFNASFIKEKQRKKDRDAYKIQSFKIKPYLNWRKNFCEICGFCEDARALQVHHLNPLLKKTDKDNPSNCITVCFSHHALIEYGKYPRWKNRAEFEKWLVKKNKLEKIKNILSPQESS